jgi:DNA-binding NtrC family response regulator
MRKPLLRTLESLGVDLVVCSRVSDAEESLLKLPVDLVFCDEHLPDGGYAHLIHAHHSENCIPRVVVTTRHGDWDLYFHALAKGAFDVIRCPCNATDVEMVIIRALREGDAFATASA